MGLLEVDIEGLPVLAARCDSLAAEIGPASTAPVGAHIAGQATALAVAQLHADVGVAAAALVARLQSTAAALATGGNAFAAQEQDSSAALAALAPTGL